MPNVRKSPIRAAIRAVATAVAISCGASAYASTIADFELSGSTADAVGGSAILTSNGGILETTGIRFGVNQGPTITGLGALGAYTIDVGFTLDTVKGANGADFIKLIDFSGLSEDRGFYSYRGALSAYPIGNSDQQVFSANTPVRLTLSRDTTGLLTAYIDGEQIFARNDPSNLSGTRIDASTVLNFFADDRATGKGEAASGFVDYIRIADTAVSPDQITPRTPAVPEPAAWAMMLVGFGMMGQTLRMRRSAGLSLAA